MEGEFRGRLEELQGSYRTRMVHLGEMEPSWYTREAEGIPPAAVLTGIKVGSDKFVASPRFMQSFWTRFGLSPSVFSIMEPDECFKRLADRHPRAQTVLTNFIAGRALAMSSPATARISPLMVAKLLEMPGINRGDRKVRELTLSEEGMIQTTHSLPDAPVQIGGEGFLHEFFFETPIDGYGSPMSFISLLRLICLNGMVAYRPAFRSIFKVSGDGEDQVIYGLHRILSSFTNEEGFQALNERSTKAMVTAPSVSEYAAFRGLLVQELRQSRHAIAILDLLDKKLGSISEMYSVATVTDLDAKRAKTMPRKGTLGDVINIATEISSHYPATVRDPNTLHSWVGQLIQETYDLEDIKEWGEPKGDIAPRDRYLSEVFAQAA